MLNEKVIGDFAYTENRQIGSGQFSQVYMGYNCNTNEIVAIKKIVKKSIKGIFEIMLKNEIQVLKTVNHRYILKLLAFYETQNNFYIITDHCETDLLQILKKHGTINEFKAKELLLQVAEALQYLHSMQILHRDIKPPNILLKNGEVRLADFGFSQMKQQQKEQHSEMSRFQVGSPLYMSPETIFTNYYDYHTDVWALGILYYEMIFGIVPFFSMDLPELIEKLRMYQKDYSIVFPRKIAQNSTFAIQSMLAFDPKHRCDLIKLRKILKNTPITPVHVSGSAGINPFKRQTEYCMRGKSTHEDQKNKEGNTTNRNEDQKNKCENADNNEMKIEPEIETDKEQQVELLSEENKNELTS